MLGVEEEVIQRGLCIFIMGEEDEACQRYKVSKFIFCVFNISRL